MNRLLLLTIFLVLFSVSVFAEENVFTIDAIRSELAPGETVQAMIVIDNELSPLTGQNVQLYLDNGIDLVQMPIAPFLSQINNTHYFLYFTMPVEVGNYLLSIEGVAFLVNDVLELLTIHEELTLVNSSPSLEITPGFFFFERDTEKSVQLNIKGNDVNTQVSFVTPSFITHNYQEFENIEVGKKRKFTLTYTPTMNLTDEIQITSGEKIFTLPLFFSDEEEVIEDPPQEQDETVFMQFLTAKETFTKTIGVDEVLEGPLKMKNLLDTTLENVQITIEGEAQTIISLNQSSFAAIPPGALFTTQVTIHGGRYSSVVSEGTLVVVHAADEARLPITITIQEKITIEELPGDQEGTQEENDSEDYLQDFVPWTVDDVEETPAVKGTSKAVAAMVVILLFLAIMIFLLSQKKITKKKGFEQVVKEAQKKR